MLGYYFTTFGDIYSGYEFHEHQFPNHKIIIQGTKLKEYKNLPRDEKNLERIKEFGWAIHKNTLINELLENEFRLPPQKEIEEKTWNGEFQRKHMFIFGAGASANCAYGGSRMDFDLDASKPPLGPELFHYRFCNIYENYKGVKQSLINLQETEIDVELLFEQEWNDVQENGNPTIMSRHINIQFYLQDIISKISNHVIAQYYRKNLYALFSEKLQRIYNQNKQNQFAFVSFNYDTILEHFLQEYFFSDTKLKSHADYIHINNFPFCFFKPHGSWNWGWKFPKDIWSMITNHSSVADWLFRKQKNFHDIYVSLLGRNSYNMIDWSGWGMECGIHKHDLGKFTIDKSKMSILEFPEIGSYFPALLLPYRDKDEFTMPPTHYYTMSHYLSEVETLTIIGWKGNEAAFNRLLINRAHRLKKIIIADPNPKLVEDNLKDIISKKGLEIIHYKNFEDYVLNGIDKELKIETC